MAPISYQPIACSLHDEYEIAIMHKNPKTIKWQGDDGQFRQENVLAKDILVKNKEEFLLAITRDNENLCIRLDKISLMKQGA